MLTKLERINLNFHRHYFLPTFIGMKHLLIVIFNLYFIGLMVVPCNHTILYANIIENALGMELHQGCSHEEHQQHHEHHDHSSNHHHSCTPFCTCGVVHFVLNTPPFYLEVEPLHNNSTTSNPIQATIWSSITNPIGKLMVNNIWNPPKSV